MRMAQIATGNIDEALDILQDAMLGFVARYADKPVEECQPLFYRVLQSRITDWHRRNAVRSRWRVWFGRSDDQGDEREDMLANIADPGALTSDAILVHQAEGEAIQAALRRLPLRQQQAFLLRAWEGLDTARTAFAMGCSEGSVKTHYSRAIHTLREILEEYRP